MTRAARRAAAATALVLGVALATAGCTGSEDSSDGSPTAPQASATEREAVPQVSLGKVTGKLPAAEGDRLVSDVGDLVAGWVDAAYLGGTYPRRDFSDAWPGFTKGAQAEAHQDRGLMSNEDIGDKIDGIDPHKVVVRLDVLAVKKRPVGVTAHVYLGFGTTGDLEKQVRVKGRLFLTRDDGGDWQVFGYDVTKGAV
jgi:hypothetical protein